MYEDILELVTVAAKKRNLKESTSSAYCHALRPFFHYTGKPWQELTISDADNYLTAKRLDGIMPETYNHYYGAYFHVVFTVPQELNPLIYCNQQLLYDALYHSVSSTINELTEDTKHLRAKVGYICVLHTWGSLYLLSMRFQLHHLINFK